MLKTIKINKTYPHNSLKKTHFDVNLQKISRMYNKQINKKSMRKLYTKTLLLLVAMMLSSVAFAANTAPRFKGGDSEIRTRYISHCAMALEWTPVIDDNTLAEDIKYVIEWSTSAGKQYTKMEVYGETSLYYGALTPNTEYIVYIEAYDKNNAKILYDKLEFETLSMPSTSDSAPTISTPKLTTSKTNHSITLSWTKATDDKTAQKDLYYLLRISSPNSSGSWIQVVGFDKDSHVLSGISANTQYQIDLLVYDNNGRSSEYTTTTVTTNNYSSDYDLYVGGTRVTTDNSANIFGDGKVWYDPARNMLTLNNANIVCSGSGPNAANAGIYSKIKGLTIRVNGNSTVKNENFTALSLVGDATITSNDEDDVLNLAAASNYAAIISSSKANDLTLTGHVEIRSSQYGSFIRAFRNVDFDDCIIKATGTGKFMYETTSINFNEDKLMRMVEHVNATIEQIGSTNYLVSKEGAQEAISGPVTIVPTYGYAIDGVCAWSGSAQEMKEKYGIQTLNELGIAIQSDDIPSIDHIYCYMPCTPKSEFAVMVYGKANIKKMTLSAAKNYIAAYYGWIAMKSDGSDMYAIGVEQQGYDRLVSIQSSGVYISGHTYGVMGLTLEVKDQGALYANATESGVQWLDDLLMEEGVKIWLPENGRFASGHIVGSNNKTAQEVFIGVEQAYKELPQWKDIVTDINTTEMSGINTNNATYSIMGTRVNDSYRGIVIRNGKKMLVK